MICFGARLDSTLNRHYPNVLESLNPFMKSRTSAFTKNLMPFLLIMGNTDEDALQTLIKNGICSLKVLLYS